MRTPFGVVVITFELGLICVRRQSGTRHVSCTRWHSCLLYIFSIYTMNAAATNMIPYPCIIREWNLFLCIHIFESLHCKYCVCIYIFFVFPFAPYIDAVMITFFMFIKQIWITKPLLPVICLTAKQITPKRQFVIPVNLCFVTKLMVLALIRDKRFVTGHFIQHIGYYLFDVAVFHKDPSTPHMPLERRVALLWRHNGRDGV